MSSLLSLLFYLVLLVSILTYISIFIFIFTLVSLVSIIVYYFTIYSLLYNKYIIAIFPFPYLIIISGKIIVDFVKTSIVDYLSYLTFFNYEATNVCLELNKLHCSMKVYDGFVLKNKFSSVFKSLTFKLYKFAIW